MRMDDISRYNKERWEALAAANVEFSRPWLALTPETARNELDPYGVMGPVEGKRVLCLAASGGQQSAAFGLLGAQVSVFDISETQLQRDRAAAAHYGLSIETVQGDMRDLSVFVDASFDLVWHAFSISFIPDTKAVFGEVARVLRPGGLYRLQCANPFVVAIDERSWDGKGYPLSQPYVDGEIVFEDPAWDVYAVDGTLQRVEGPREFRHTLSTLINGLVRYGFIIIGLREELGQDPGAAPGTWEHYKRVAPPWFTFWMRYRPDVFVQ